MERDCQVRVLPADNRLRGCHARWRRGPSCRPTTVWTSGSLIGNVALTIWALDQSHGEPPVFVAATITPQAAGPCWSSLFRRGAAQPPHVRAMAWAGRNVQSNSGDLLRRLLASAA